MTHDSTRRRFVAGLSATVALGGLAGCSSDSGSGDSTTDAMAESTDAMNESTEAMAETTDSMGDGMSNGTDTMGGETTTDAMMEQMDPAEAPRASVDRFSGTAGTLLVRSEGNDLPGPDEAIDFDQQPFLTTGLGPDGSTVQYYNFDVQPTSPAPIYALFRQGEDKPVEGQLNLVDVIPGDEGYNDFWQVHKVTVPEDYVANSITSVSQLMEGDYAIKKTTLVKNCPVVPDGSTASKRAGDGNASLVEGWYDGKVVSYFVFEEDTLTTSNGSVPTSPIYVTFNKNPGTDGGGPPSGFKTEQGSDQTHNVVATLPGDDGYSPLWMVNIYDNADFGAVSNLDSVSNVEILKTGAANVNCPIVST